MSSPIPWRVYRRHGPRPAKYLGVVYADDKTAATDEAKRTFPPMVAKPLDVIADAAWRLMNAFERSVFMGTFTLPTEARIEGERRISLCKGCKGEIVRTKEPGQARWGRPMTYHDACMPDSLKRFRKYYKARNQLPRPNAQLEIAV
jgi:hypothetical protein